MYVNIINSYRNVIAIADKELLGKVFEEENKQLDVKESFYKGELKSREETAQIIEEWIQEDATFNIVGKNATKLAVEIGIINEEGIEKIDGISYAMILL